MPSRKIPMQQLDALQDILQPGTLVSIYRQHFAGIATQQELADAAREFMPAGMSMNRKTIQGLEAGEPDYAYPTGRYVTAIHLLAIARALGIPPTWISPDLADDKNIATIIDLVQLVEEPNPPRRPPEPRSEQGIRKKARTPILAFQTA